MSNRQVRPIGSGGLGFVFSVVFCAPALAQMAVSPIIIETRAHPGGVRTFAVNITSTGKHPLECTVRVSAMAVHPGGLPVEVEEAPRSCKDWITVKPDKFTLKPKEGKRLVCQVRVPKEAGGGYYAIISCHGVPQDRAAPEAARRGLGAGIRFTHRALVPVMLTIPAPRMRAIIDAAKPVITADKGGRSYTLNLPVRNRGNIHTRMGGTVEVRSEAEQLIEKFELAAGRGFLLPMHERLFKSKLRVSLPDGVYLAKIRLEAKGAAPMLNAFGFYIKDARPTVAELTEELKAKLMKQSAGFTVTPSQMLVALRPGASRMQAFELVNLTRKAIELRVSLVEWYRTPDGRDLAATAKPLHGRSGREWITLRDKQVKLRPLSRQRVPVTVKLPKSAEGEAYAAVTFDRDDVQLDASPAGRARRGAMLRLWAEGTGTESANVTAFEATRKPNGTLVLSVRFKNTGSLSIRPDPRFSVEDVDGRTVGKPMPSTPPSAVQAGGEGIVTAEWPRVLDPGSYTAELTFRFSPKEPPIMSRTKFTVPQPAEATTGPATRPAATAPSREETTR